MRPRAANCVRCTRYKTMGYGLEPDKRDCRAALAMTCSESALIRFHLRFGSLRVLASLREVVNAIFAWFAYLAVEKRLSVASCRSPVENPPESGKSADQKQPLVVHIR
jgi:hypothetical protein